MRTQFLGIAGLVLLGFGIMGGFVAGFLNEIVILHLLLGAAALGTWVALIGAKNLNEASQVIKGRNTRFGVNLVLYAIVFIGILYAINWIALRHNKRWDLTENNVYSLAPQSVSLMQGLQKPLKLVTFKGLVENQDKVDELLHLYKDSNPAKVSVDSIDPKAKPHLIEKYGIKPGNQIYIEYGEGDKTSVSRINESTQQAVTNSILKLTRGEAKKVYFVQGHGEPALDDAKAQGINRLALALKDEHLNGEAILLAQHGKIPDDAAGVVLISPKQSLLPEEKKLLIDYGKSGGRLLLLGDPNGTDDVSDIAKEFGISIEKTVVIDQIQRLFSAPALGAQPVAETYDPTSPITKELSKQNPSVFNIAATISKVGEGEQGATYVELVKSSPTAWGEKNLTSLFNESDPTATKDADDVSGPVTLAMSYEKKIQESGAKKGETDHKFEKVSRVVAFGDSDWIVNANLHVFSNRDLFLNSINWLAGEEGGYTIREGAMRASQAPITRASYMLILLTSFLAPELILLFGLSVWWKRRAGFAVAA